MPARLPIQDAEILACYRKYGSAVVAGRILGVSRGTVAYRLKKAGFKLRNQGRPSLAGHLRRAEIVARVTEWAANLDDEQLRRVASGVLGEIRKRGDGG